MNLKYIIHCFICLGTLYSQCESYNIEECFDDPHCIWEENLVLQNCDSQQDELVCNSINECSWEIQTTYYSCSNFGSSSSCSEYSDYGCSWEWSWGGWGNHGSSCAGGGFQIDNSICGGQDYIIDEGICILDLPLDIEGFFLIMGINYYTQEGLDKLRAELNQLKDIERPNASKAIAEARDKGDLSENAEYDAAKEAQGLLELKISKLEETLSQARLIDESQLDTSKILVLSKVEIKNELNGATMNYQLVAESEADLKSGKISVNSPIGKGLLGKSVGDFAEISVPNGKIKFKILSITR